jgi:two-component system chemotaxis response regulator CheB
MIRVKSGPIRVVIIEDSPVARDLLAALLQEAGGIQVVGVGANGEDAVRLTKRLRPDLVTMDVRMPKMDGLEATRRIMRDVPTPIVIVTASPMRADMDLTFEALQAGALTVVSKPGLADPETCDRLVQTVRLMADVPVVHHWGRGERQPLEALPGMAVAPTLPVSADGRRSVQLVGIAASTGGPSALAAVLRSLPADFPLPILVVQHVTPGFAAGLAEWLDGEMPLRVRLAGHGDTLQAGTVLLAPDDYHLQVNGRGAIELCKEQPYRGLRPSANYMFHSLARFYGPRALGIILTGMGDDGAEGLEALHQAGGLVMAQDEQSCVVYGMPREAVLRNIVDQVLSPGQIAATLSQLAQPQPDSRRDALPPAQKAVPNGTLRRGDS